MFRRALKDGVTPEGWLALEGPVVLEEILHGGAVHSEHGLLRSASRIRSVLVSEDAEGRYGLLLKQLASEAEVAQIPDAIFRSVAQTVNPQGLAALVEVTPPEMAAVLAQRDVLAMVACGLQEPGNLGTIARTAEAFGAGALLALKSTVNAFNPKAVRASGGAVFRLPIYTGLEPSQTFERLARVGIRLAAAEPRGETQLPVADLHGSLAILVGNEAAGLDPGIACRASLRLRIPIRPEVDSINAATSAGILLYEVARQRGFQY